MTELKKDAQCAYREEIKLDCMATAICIAGWSMLTWDSKWLDELSSCKITLAEIGIGEEVHVICSNLCYQVSGSFRFSKRGILIVNKGSM